MAASAKLDSWKESAARFAAGRPTGPKSAEALQLAVSMATAIYGSSSPQLKMIEMRAEAIGRDKGYAHPFIMIYDMAKGAIENMVAELDAGLEHSVRLKVAGDILADLIYSARQAIYGGSLPVAAVLTAAAFEDLLRRLAAEKMREAGRPKLEEVITKLKEAGVLQGGEPTLILSFLKFRNDSLHADWQKVTDTQVSSCLTLLDNLLIKHFS